MKFYIDGKIVTSKDHPLIVVLSKQDKVNIANMIEGATVYSVFEKGDHSVEEIEAMLTRAKELGASK